MPFSSLLVPKLRWGPGAGWANTSGTATLVNPSGQLPYWEFLDNNNADRVEIAVPLPDIWAGRAINAYEIDWATDGVSTANMIFDGIIYDYVAGSDLANGTGNIVISIGSQTITPSGTAHQIERKSITPSASFTVGADLLRIIFRRRSDLGGDTNTDGLRIYGWSLSVQ